MDQPLYQVRGLDFAYGRYQALSGLDLEVPAGHMVGLLGPNGSGKTTLLDCLLGLAEPAAGSVSFLGKHITQYSRRQMARLAALVPQDHSLRFPYTVRQLVAMGRHPHQGRFQGLDQADYAICQSAMEMMDLNDMADKSVTDLSGGERQRAALARALAQDTPVLLLDEPTASLDLSHALAALGVVERQVAQGRSAVCVLHDLNLAAAFCTHLVVLRKGRLAAQGPTAEVLTSALLDEVFGVRAEVMPGPVGQGPRVIFHKEPPR